MIRKIQALTLVAALGGCGSLLNFDHWDGGPRVYGGVYLDATGHCWTNNVIGYVDLPFSFVVDTALFPIYLVFELFR